VSLETACEYKISKENTTVFIVDGAEFLEPIDGLFKSVLKTEN